PVLTRLGVLPASSVVVTVNSRFSTLSSDSSEAMIGIVRSSTVCKATGTAMMKMMSITSITSTRGVVLMSDIGVSVPPPVEIAIVHVLYQFWAERAGGPHAVARPSSSQVRSSLRASARRRGDRGAGRGVRGGRSGRPGSGSGRLGGSRGTGGGASRLHRAARGDVGQQDGRE